VAEVRLQCHECNRIFEEDPDLLVCPECSKRQVRGASLRGVLEVEILEPPSRWPAGRELEPRFLESVLPLGHVTHAPPLAVGNTPLLDVPRLRSELGMPRLRLKDDTRNPSGSSKDQRCRFNGRDSRNTQPRFGLRTR